MHRLFPCRGEPRYEVKFVAEPIRMNEIMAWIDCHPDGFFKAFPDRQIQNIYFDTFDLAAYASNEAGIGLRTKPRFRWYGPSRQIEKGTFEVKCKQDFLGWKYLQKVALCVDLETMTWSQIRDRLRATLEPANQLLLDVASQAALYNHYHRKYFVSADGQIRITIDRDHRVFWQVGHGRPQFRRPGRTPALLIVEVKASAEQRRRLTRVLRDMPLRASKHSKYVSGVESVLWI